MMLNRLSEMFGVFRNFVEKIVHVREERLKTSAAQKIESNRE